MITDRSRSTVITSNGDTVLHALLLMIEKLLHQPLGRLNYQQLTNDLLTLSGAKVTLINIFTDSGRTAETRAVSGIAHSVQQIAEVLGFKLAGALWDLLPHRIQSLKGGKLTRYNDLSQISAGAISKETASLLKRILNYGDIYLIEIADSGGRTLGNLLFVMPKGKDIENPEAIEIYAGHIGTLFMRIKAEAALQQSEAFITSVMDNLPIGIAVNSVEPNVCFEYINDNFIKFYRTTREALAKPGVFWDVVYQDPEIREALKQQILQDCAGRNPQKMQWADIPITRSGEETTYITAKNIPIPGKPLMISTVWDVTERKLQQDALQKEQREKNLILKNISELVTYLDLEMRIIWANPAVSETHKKRPEEFLGQKCFSVWHGFSEPCPGCPVTEVIKTGKISTGETGSPDGRFWKVAGSPVRDDQGVLIGVLDTSLDITDLKRAEAKLIQANTELEQRVRLRTAELEMINQELDAFTYSVSHDLRAPLRGINGFSQAVLEDYSDLLDAKGQDYLRRVRSASQRMDDLIDDLLKLSRVSRQEIRREPVDLSALTGKILATLQEGDPKRRVDKLIAPGQRVSGDAALLRIAMENLLENAWKFTGRLTSARIEFGQKRLKGRRVYYIRDNGAGFDMAYADKLFAAFQRLHSPQDYPGTGIGLSIVSRIIRRHGGELWAEGEVDRGATFYFTLPA